jgi:hypothetical protein
MASTPRRSPSVGIQEFSTRIALDPTLSIYRRFATLNARNLLYLQSELASLEARIVEGAGTSRSYARTMARNTIEEDEELALALLRKR